MRFQKLRESLLCEADRPSMLFAPLQQQPLTARVVRETWKISSLYKSEPEGKQAMSVFRRGGIHGGSSLGSTARASAKARKPIARRLRARQRFRDADN